MPREANLLSIGALSRATGVPAETLRTWERRYGFPSGERTESGHRRYSMLTLDRLRLVTQVLELGYPPSSALVADAPTLHEMLRAAKPLVAADAPLIENDPAVSPGAMPPAIEPWFEHIERFEGRAFERELRTAWAEHGGLAFIEHRAAPFTVELGLRWARGQLSVGQEHFASERLREFLVQQWRPLSDAATGGSVVCATPRGETHVLGLHMAALTLSLGNARIVFLGADAPPQDIASTAAHHAAEAVVLSASASIDRVRLRADVAALRGALGSSSPILGGGAGFVPELPGVVVLSSFGELQRWYEERARAT
jgi:methanogenic corrinoid protein MtbC1